jgi:ABC-type transport system substrate-binding protein
VTSVIDQSQIIKVVWNGLAQSASSPFPSLIPYFDPRAKKFQAPYDPAGAAKVFAAKGVTSLDLVIGSPSFDATTAQLIQAELGQAGVKVNIIQKDDAGYYALLQRGQDDMFLNGWGCGDPDCVATFMSPSQIGPGGSNFTRVNDPKLNALFKKGREATTQKATAAAYAAIQERIYQQAYVLGLYNFISTYALRDRVHGFSQDPFQGQIWSALWVG